MASDKKNIDRLFQEKFKDFEVTPNEELWTRIESELDKGKKKDRKIIPIWWRLGGVAAVLALLFTIGYNVLKTDINNVEPPIVDTENGKTSKGQQHPSNPKEESTEQTTTGDTLGNDVVVSDADTKKNKDKAGNDQLINNKGRIDSRHSKSSKEAIVIATNQNAQTNRAENKNISAESNKALVSNNTQKENVGIVDNQNNDLIKESHKTDSTGKNKKFPVKTEDAFAQKEDHGKKSLLDVIDEQQKEKETIVAEASKKHWSISPSLAPVYYNSLGNGSPIHSQFAKNPKSGDVNMSYGVNIAYEINNRLSVRSGINKVSYGYNTKGIEFTSTLQSQNLKNVDYASRSATIEVANDVKPSTSFQADIISAKNTVYNGSINQQFGYLEVPVELKYRLVNKRFGMNVIGGVSSLFLTDNNISVESLNGLSTDVGEANNLNDLNFSTNIGLGFDYKVSEKLQLNLEPMFKYQLNTFSNDAGGFKPYSLGVYTGFSFRF